MGQRHRTTVVVHVSGLHGLVLLHGHGRRIQCLVILAYGHSGGEIVVMDIVRVYVVVVVVVVVSGVVLGIVLSTVMSVMS